MKIFGFLTGAVIIALITAPAFADENATGGGIINSESVFLGAGPFDHTGNLGDLLNATTTATFVGGFNATHVRFAGDWDEVILATFGSEADINIVSPVIPPSLTGTPFVWQNPSPTVGPFSYDIARDLTGTFAGGIDAAGTWDVEFFESFDDGAGADSTSSNVTMTFEELEAINDVNGSFALNALVGNDSDSSNGELALSGLFDLYTISLVNDGLFSFMTEFNDGFTGETIDTEIAIFDSAGILLDQDDDGGPGTYSGIFDLALTAGDYTLAVAGFNTTFADGFTVNPGNATGDYRISASLVNNIPEPSSMGILAIGLCGLMYRRRRK